MGITILLTVVLRSSSGFKDFSTPLLLVQYISADASGNTLLDALNKLGKLTCLHATQGLKVSAGHVYLAPSDQHIMIDKSGFCWLQKVLRKIVTGQRLIHFSVRLPLHCTGYKRCRVPGN